MLLQSAYMYSLEELGEDFKLLLRRDMTFSDGREPTRRIAGIFIEIVVNGDYVPVCKMIQV